MLFRSTLAEAASYCALTARIALERTRRLFESNLASKSDLDTSSGNYQSVKAQYEAASANVQTQQAAIGEIGSWLARTFLPPS